MLGQTLASQFYGHGYHNCNCFVDVESGNIYPVDLAKQTIVMGLGAVSPHKGASTCCKAMRAQKF